jgi:hypothetical protein
LFSDAGSIPAEPTIRFNEADLHQSRTTLVGLVCSLTPVQFRPSPPFDSTRLNSIERMVSSVFITFYPKCGIF